MQIVETVIVALVGVIVALTAALKWKREQASAKDKPAPEPQRRDTGPIPAILSKDDIRDMFVVVLKDVIPVLLKDNMPCFRNEQDCASKVRTLLVDQYKEKLDKALVIAQDNSRRIYDIQRKVCVDKKDRPTYPLLPEQDR